MNDRAARLLEVWQRSARGAHRREQIDVDTFRPRFLVVPRAEARRVVHEHVDAAQRLGRGRHVARHSARVREVTRHCMYFVAKATKLAFGFPQRRFASCANRDIRARLGEREGDRATDAARAPGDECVASCEL